MLQNPVQCGNVMNTVKDWKVLTRIKNKSENSIKLQAVDLNNLLYEKFEEANIQLCTKLPEIQNNGDHLEFWNNY